MSAKLLIRDGDPYWYLSTDIWTVRQPDPSGAHATPVAGQPSYLCARIFNTGDADVDGVRVDFYWANPATQVTRSNANFIGSAFGDVAANGSQEVLCLIPWVPVMVNGGHECLIAVANHAADPLPVPPPDAFDPPAFPQVAQRNLTVVAGMVNMILVLTVGGLARRDKDVRLATEVGGTLNRESLQALNLEGFRPADDGAVEVGLNKEPGCVLEDEPIGDSELRIQVPKGSSAAVYVAVRVKQLASDQYQLVRVVEEDDQKVLGGIGLVVVASKEGNR